MTDITEIIGRIRRPERTVTIPLRGDLLAEWDELEQALDDAAAEQSTSLAEASPSRGIAERMDALRGEIRESEQTFRFRGLTDRALSDLTAKHPPRDGKDETWNPETFVPALIAACAVDPAMTPEQATALISELHRASANKLFGGAWYASTGAVDVPFSERASEILRSTGAK